MHRMQNKKNLSRPIVSFELSRTNIAGGALM
jgi:hypothetical protein